MKFKIGDKVIEMLEDDGLSKKEIIKNVFDALKQKVNDREPMSLDEFEQYRGYDRVFVSDVMEKASDEDKTAILNYFDTLPFVNFHTDDSDAEDATTIYVDKEHKVLLIDGDDKVLDEEPEEEVEVKEEVKEVEDADRDIPDEVVAHELALYIENKKELYKSMLVPIINNLHKHYKKGEFDEDLAVKAILPLCRKGAKMYAKENADSHYSELFTAATRELCAKELLERSMENIEKGDLMPKKDSCKDKLRHWFVNKETGELKSLEELKKEYDYAEWDDTCAQSVFEEWEYWKKADIDDAKKKSCKDYDIYYDPWDTGKVIYWDEISTNIRPDGTLEIYRGGNKIIAEIEDGREDKDFVDEVLTGMGYFVMDSKKLRKDSKKKSICDICGQEVKDIEKIGQHFCVCPECKRLMKESDIELLK